MFTHTNGNIAAANLKAQVNFGTNIKEQESVHLPLEINYLQNISSIASSTGVFSTSGRSNKFVIGKYVLVDLVDNGNAITVNSIKLDHIKQKEIYQESKYIDFDEEFSKLNNISNTLPSQTCDFKITKEDFSDAFIMWNFSNSLNNLIMDSPFQGTVLSPNASVNVKQNLDGSIIATNVTINAQSHRWDLNPFTVSDIYSNDNKYSETTQSSENNSESSLPKTGSSDSWPISLIGFIFILNILLCTYKKNNKRYNSTIH